MFLRGFSHEKRLVVKNLSNLQPVQTAATAVQFRQFEVESKIPRMISALQSWHCCCVTHSQSILNTSCQAAGLELTAILIRYFHSVKYLSHPISCVVSLMLLRPPFSLIIWPLNPEQLMAGRGAGSCEGKMPKISDSRGFKPPRMIYI